jgi:hypothetical protein
MQPSSCCRALLLLLLIVVIGTSKVVVLVRLHEEVPAGHASAQLHARQEGT